MLTDEHICTVVRRTFQRYLATDDVYGGTIESVQIDKRTEQYAEVRVTWTFKKADSLVPDDALYTVCFEGELLTDVDGPEW